MTTELERKVRTYYCYICNAVHIVNPKEDIMYLDNPEELK